ncbi:MAG: hypothetical protein EON61_10530 [Alphaproteobacteria bacterium]|nr:MAG: hypothetical protein EON61_10530 [Alphaproteobacteria bacterium]
MPATGGGGDGGGGPAGGGGPGGGTTTTPPPPELPPPPPPQATQALTNASRRAARFIRSPPKFPHAGNLQGFGASGNEIDGKA